MVASYFFGKSYVNPHINGSSSYNSLETSLKKFYSKSKNFPKKSLNYASKLYSKVKRNKRSTINYLGLVGLGAGVGAFVANPAIGIGILSTAGLISSTNFLYKTLVHGKKAYNSFKGKQNNEKKIKSLSKTLGYFSAFSALIAASSIGFYSLTPGPLSINHHHMAQMGSMMTSSFVIAFHTIHVSGLIALNTLNFMTNYSIAKYRDILRNLFPMQRRASVAT